MKNKVGVNNFLVSIIHQENQSWQGVIEWLDTGKKIHFRSELEMINLIHNAVQESNVGGLRTWDEATVLNVV